MVKQEKPTVAPKSRPPAPAKPEPLKTPVDAYVLLMPKGTDFRIHKTDCKSYKAQKAQSSYKGLQDYKLEGIVNQLEVIRDVWDDQIREQWEEEHADPEDPEKEIPDYGTAPWSWLNANGYVHSVEFHTCLNGLPQQAKGAAKTANTRKLAKTELATLVAEAAGQMLEDLLGANLADPDDPYARAAEMITSGFKGDDEIRQCVAQWLHGLPCDRDRWVAAGMAIPDRSDWAGFAARRAAASDGQSPEEATDEPEEDSDTAPAMDGDEDVELPTE